MKTKLEVETLKIWEKVKNIAKKTFGWGEKVGVPMNVKCDKYNGNRLTKWITMYMKHVT